MRFRTICIAVAESGLSLFWPAKMYLPVLAFDSSFRMSSALADSGTRCSRAAFILAGGMVHKSFSMLISRHSALRTSEDLAAVKIANSNAAAAVANAVDIRQVGRELGVRYVLEGGVRKAGNRLRITAQLIEAEAGAHLWADRFDGGLDDVFELQDQIIDKVIGIVEPSLQRSEIERARQKHPESLGAHDLYLRALPHFAARKPVEARIAAQFLEDALKLDPNYAPAHALLAHCYQILFIQGGHDMADKAAGLRHAHAAIAADVDDAVALAIAGVVIGHLGKDHESAIRSVEIGRAHV